jgi:amino acid transporter
MDLLTTTALAAAALLFAVFCGWRGARPINVLKGPRMVPWRPLMVAGAVVAILMAAHILNLLGMKTGDPRY